MVRSKWSRRICYASIFWLTGLYLLINVPWLRSLGCISKGPLASTTICRPRQDEWNLLYHLGGNSPWIPRNTSREAENQIPPSCSVTQAHMLARHAERYPTKNAGSRHLALLDKLKSSEVQLPRSMTFIHGWTYFTNASDPLFDDLVSDGPYAGTLQAYNTGVNLKKRYYHLAPIKSATKIWSCGSARDISTARWFAAGFFDREWETEKHAELLVVPETPNQGANTLTPGETCTRYREDKLQGHDYGYLKLTEWQSIFTAKIATRLQLDTSGLDLTPSEIYSMMEICTFEILARGSSPWCEVFTNEEWLEFEYARDILHFYRAGPGNSYSGSMGLLWLNATYRLLAEERKGNYFSFVHDSDIIAAISALSIMNEANTTQHLPTNYVKRDRRWRTSDVVPMAGRLVFEKIVCSIDLASPMPPRVYVRLLVNEGVFDLDGTGSDSGIFGAIPLAQYELLLQNKRQEFGDFKTVCNLGEDVPTLLTFLEQ